MNSIVEETGETLIRASHSTNIKERRDCSTALFNAKGETLCQAEHIPIHLGSFIELVPHIMKRYRAEDINAGRRLHRQRCLRGRRHPPARHRAGRADLRRRKVRGLDGEPRPPCRLRRPRPRPHLPGGPAHPAGAALSRRRAAGRRPGPDPAQLPGAARAAVGPARPDGRQPRRRAALPVALRQVRHRDRAGRRRGADGLRRAQDARRDRGHARRHLALRGRVRQRGGQEQPAALRRGDGEGRHDVARLRRAGPGARRHQHDLHRAARDHLLRREVGARSLDFAERRAGAAARLSPRARAASSTAPTPRRSTAVCKPASASPTW